MVGAVKKWQKSDPQKSLDTWRRLSEANSALEMQLNLLTKLAKEQWEAYKCVINNCSRLRSDKVFPVLTCYSLSGSYLKNKMLYIIRSELKF